MSARRSSDASDASTSSQRQEQDEGPTEDKSDDRSTKHPGVLRALKKAWEKLGLDRDTVLLMMKGAIPPTIAVSIYQSESVASDLTTVGYLAAVVSVLGFAIMPRAKFLQMMLLDLCSLGVATGLALLTMYSAIKAREHTSQPVTSNGGHPAALSSKGAYNSSASAVSGVWLFFQIYFINAVRARYPQFQFPVVIYSIFASVTSTFAPQLPNMAAAINLVIRLLEAFLIGLALATATSLLILPRSTRDIVFGEMTAYIEGLRGALRAHAAYFESLEHDDMFGRTDTYDSRVEKVGKKGKLYSPEAEAIRSALRRLMDLHAKLHGEITFAKREFALGKLGPDDLKALFKHLRLIMTPVVGLGFVVDIFQRLSDINKWNEPLDAGAAGLTVSDAVRDNVVHGWNDIMTAVHDPFASMIETIDEGLQHAKYVLQLAKPPKGLSSSAPRNSDDVEARAAAVPPGEKGFADNFEKRLRQFGTAKRVALRTWSADHGFPLPDDFFDNPSAVRPDFELALNGDRNERDRARRQLYLFLYMDQLLHSTGQVVLNFVRFADERSASGKLSKTRLIVPGVKRMKKWLQSSFTVEDSPENDDYGDIHTQSHILQLGEAYRNRKDPEHLPPETMFQRIGDKIRCIPIFLRSPESTYGFRVACATMTVAVVAFLQQTQRFFVEQRLVWAMIMVNLSMSPTAGQSVFSFVFRIVGTTVAMVCSFLVWYIPDQKTPGIIVVLFLFMSMGFYVPIKLFRFRVVGVISIVTLAIIIGYELQVRKVGESVATSNGQPYYPIYLLAPYRLATVIGGIIVAFIWTFFPYPISEHSVLRQSLGGSLYLLANYYSIIHETLAARMRGNDADMIANSASGRRLEKARHRVYSKQMLLLNRLRDYSSYLRWEISIGGRFPKKKYDAIILCIENIVNYLSLLGYASDTLMRLTNNNDGDDGDTVDTAWNCDFKRLAASTHITSHKMTSILCLLSASITNRQPLPPYLKTPQPYSFSKKLEELDKDILSIRHVTEPGFAAFAVLQISSRCIVGDMQRLVRDIRSLVGELDFSFHAISTADSSRVTSRVTLDEPASGSGRPGDREKTD